jgi:hypothetical protein
MVKGISRQVIVVHSPDKKLFEQAIFILNENAVGKEAITDEILLKEARQAIHSSGTGKKRRGVTGPVWACGGALLTGTIWLLTLLI